MKSRIPGVVFADLQPKSDDRGILSEVFRADWGFSPPVQWNIVTSRPNVIRGLHAHLVHEDVLTVVHGEMILAIVDLRPCSSTLGYSETFRMRARETTVRIPVGVGHLFCFEDEATIAYGVSEYWNPRDELGCRWNDPALSFELPLRTPILSDRDRNAGSFEDLRIAVGRAISPDRI